MRTEKQGITTILLDMYGVILEESNEICFTRAKLL